MRFSYMQDFDVVVTNHEHLESLIEIIGEPNWYNDLTVLTDDGFTRGRGKLNLIVEEDGEYIIGTQLRSPFEDKDRVLDLRTDDVEE